MNKTKLIIASLFAVLAIAVVFAGPTVHAAPTDVLQKCNSLSNVCSGTDGSSLYKILKTVINLLLTIVGVISVIMIIIGGIRFATSAGDAAQAKGARETVIYAVVGLVIAIMSIAIVNFVLDKLK